MISKRVLSSCVRQAPAPRSSMSSVPTGVLGEDVVNPPRVLTKGRPRSNRRTSVIETAQPAKATSGQSASSLKATSQRACGYCRQSGHNRATCPQNKPAILELKEPAAREQPHLSLTKNLNRCSCNACFRVCRGGVQTAELQGGLFAGGGARTWGVQDRKALYYK